MKFETIAIRQQKRTQEKEHSSPIFATSSFVFDSAEEAQATFAGELQGNMYSRYSNPNTNEFIDKLCLLEGLDKGFATASGMSAMFTSIASFLEAGDHIVASRSVFGSTHQIITQVLPKWGITYTYVNVQNPSAWEKAIQKNTKMIFAESPSNPALDLIDLTFLGNLAKQYNILLNIDNCFCTPYLQTPAQFGADIVTHSATKFIDGQGRTIGGAILCKEEYAEKIKFMTRHTGPAMSPFNAWILSKSLETLAVRMDRHCQNALELAKGLEKHPKLNWVKYPFLASHPQYELAKKQMKLGGGMITFELKGGIEAGKKFLNNLKILSLTANLGDTRSIATHPASTTHSKLSEEERQAVGISQGLIRISVGLEHMEDILEDIMQAIDNISS